jgi:hypothetical protein
MIILKIFENLINFGLEIYKNKFFILNKLDNFTFQSNILILKKSFD